MSNDFFGSDWRIWGILVVGGAGLCRIGGVGGLGKAGRVGRLRIHRVQRYRQGVHKHIITLTEHRGFLIMWTEHQNRESERFCERIMS